MAIAEVLAMTAVLAGLALTSWAALVAFRLLFPRRVEIAAAEIGGAPWRSGVGGLVLIALFVACVSLQIPLLTMVGVAGLAWTGVLGAVGGAGLALRLTERMEGLNPLTAFSRAALVLVGASLLPLVGWFVFGPAVLAVAVGAGWRAVVRGEPSGLAATAEAVA